MQIGERRKNPRASSNNLIEINFLNDQKGSEKFFVEMNSISAHGLSVATESPLPEMLEECFVRIPIPHENYAIETSAERVWQLPAQSEGQRHRYGFVFAGLRSADYQSIKMLVDNSRDPSLNVDRRSQRDRRAGKKPTTNDNARRGDRRWRLPTYTLYIDGRDVDTGEYEYFPYADKAILDPRKTSEVLMRLKNGETPPETEEYVYARCCVGSDKHNALALESSRRAYEIFSNFSLVRRIKLFEDIYKLLIKNKQKLLELFVAEGHPMQLGEWEFSGMQQAFKAETVAFYKTEVAKNKKAKNSEINLLLRKPDGVVCVSPPRNAASSNSLTGALALLGGNSIVLKPPLTLPVSTIYLWRHVIDEALRMNGAPKGTLNIVVGNTARLINQWIASPLVNDIVYFGESNRGLEIGAKIYAAGKKPVLELSGKDMLLVWKDSDLEAAANSLLEGFLGSTQICMVPKMALVHDDVFDKFEEIFVGKVKTLKVGLPTDANTCLSPVSKIATFFSFLKEALSKGGVLVCGGQRIDHEGRQDINGIYLEPTVLRLDDGLPLSEMRCFYDEIFFPMIPLVRITANQKNGQRETRKKDEVIFKKMISFTRDNAYGLRISIWCRPDTYIRRFIREIHNSGLLKINCRHVEFSPYLATHGGTGKTGGPFGELNYFWQKTTHLQGVSIRR